MATKPKTFDCVEMKRRAQEEILAEWESRKHEFSSYGAFLEATVQESEWARRTWERVQKQASPVAS
jgi:hypothetical protein